MAIQGVDTKCYILALFVRDDGERFLLGSGHYEFKDTQMHFAANAIQNDIVEVQGNDGFLLAGQVRRPGTQSFDGYVGDGTMSKEETESYRRQFFSFFRKNFFYKVIYVFSDGTAIQRKSGFLVDDPTVQELYQMYPEYHVALNFEDVNYYSYSEDEEGQEQYAKEATIDTSSMRATGGLVWDNLGVVWEATQWGGEQTASGTEMTIQNDMSVMSRVDDIRLDGNTEQQTYSGKNLFNVDGDFTYGGYSNNTTKNGDGTITTSSNFSQSRCSGQKLNLLANTTYILSCNMTATTSTQPNKGIIEIMKGIRGVNMSTVARVLIPSIGEATLTFTTPEDVSEIWVDFNSNGAATSTFANIQIEQGSTATPFEPYVGGIPAPNPDYPQAVQTVTGEQKVTVTGKNLFDKVAEVATSPNYSLNPDGTITTNASNAQTGRRYMTLTMSPGTYTLSFRPYFSGVENPAIRFTIRNIDTSTDYIVKNINNPENGSLQVNRFTVENTTTVGFCIIPQAKLEDGQTFYFYDTQLEQGSTATTYEPYQSQAYKINLGKNLFDGVMENGGFDSNGINNTSTARIRSKEYISVKPETTYTISVGSWDTSKGSVVGVSLSYYNANDYTTARIGSTAWASANSGYTFTTPSDCTFVRFLFTIGASAGASTEISYTDVSDIQLELGSAATPYAPYFTPIELCKIGDYRDKIFNNDPNEDWYDPDLEDNAWYVHKETGKRMLDGTESWYLGQSLTNTSHFVIGDFNTLFIGAAVPPNDMVLGYCLSDHFEEKANLYNIDQVGIDLHVNKNLIVSVSNSLATTTADFKTWLSTHNTTVYYALATPTDTQITDATLVEQLDALGAMKLFIGENNLVVQAAGTNLPAPLSFKYYTTVAMTGAEWEEGGSGGATVVEVDSITNTYPIWRVKGPAVNPQLSVINTNTTIRYTGTVTSTQTLEIDMFNKTAKLNGVSVIGNVSGDWASLAPGTNRVIYTAENADAQPSTIEWQEVVG